MFEKFPEPKPERKLEIIEKVFVSEKDKEFYRQHKEEIAKDWEEYEKINQTYEEIVEDMDRILTTAKDPEAAKKIVLEKWKPIAQDEALRLGKVESKFQKKYGVKTWDAINQIKESEKDREELSTPKSEEERRQEKEKGDRLFQIEQQYIMTPDFYTRELPEDNSTN